MNPIWSGCAFAVGAVLSTDWLADGASIAKKGGVRRSGIEDSAKLFKGTLRSDLSSALSTDNHTA